MKYICLLFILLGVVYSKPSGHCELSSNRCILADFLPVQDSKNCTTGIDPVNSTFKECGAFETCAGPSEDYRSNFYCNKVIDYNAGGPPGAIEAACKAWKKNTFCEYNTDLLMWLIIGAIVLIGGVGFLIYYFIAKKAEADRKAKMEASAVNKGNYRRLKNSKKRLYKFEP